MLNILTNFLSQGNSKVEKASKNKKKALLVAEIALISGLTLYSVSYLARGLSIPWYYNSDEVVYTAEIIKFLELNFNQNFFDIPGTPFMFLTTILWGLWYGLMNVLGQVSTATGVKLFTFQHIDNFYALMRGLVLLFYAGSIFFTYLVGKRLTNSAGGCIAALLLAFFFPYANYNTFVRTESMGICLSLAALYLVLNAIESGKLKFFFIAGIAAGVAMAARYHFALATIPIILPLYFLLKKTSNTEEIPRIYLRIASFIGIGFIAGGIVVFLLNLGLISSSTLTETMLVTSPDTDVPKALSVMRKLWLLLAIFSLSLFIAFRIPRLRQWAKHLVQPPVVLMGTGFGIGLVLGTPTFLWRGRYLLKSIQFYSNWIDYNRLKLSPLGQYIDLYSSYWKVATPTATIGFFLVAGAVLIVLRKDRLMWPVLIGSVFAFISQPVLLSTGAHRLLPWLPYLSFVEAYPLAVVYQKVAQFNKGKLAVQLLAFSAIILIGFTTVTNGVITAANNIETLVLPRLGAVEKVSEWLEKNTKPDTDIFLSYYSFNAHTLYAWMETLGVTVPEQIKGKRKYHIWWADRTSIKNQSGQVVITQQDVDVFKPDWNNKKSGEGVDPFTEPGFTKLTSFEGGGYKLTVFSFDFKQSNQQAKQ